MHYVFQKALKLGKFIRNRLKIERGAPHLFQAIWTLAGKVHQPKILFVGYSEVNRNLAHFLYQRGVLNFTLSTRYPQNVAIQGAQVCGREALAHWHEYDLIICAASSDRYLLSGQGRTGQIIFDLSVPRNVSPEIQGVQLFNIETLNQWIEQRRALQFDQVKESLDLLGSEIQRMARHYAERDSKIGFGRAGILAF
jgi:glutamyl-tRNA reductase